MGKNRIRLILGVQIIFLVSLLIFGASYKPALNTGYDNSFRFDLAIGEPLLKAGKETEEVFAAMLATEGLDASTYAVAATGENQETLFVATLPAEGAQPAFLVFTMTGEGESRELTGLGETEIGQPFGADNANVPAYLRALLEAGRVEALAKAIQTSPALATQLGDMKVGDNVAATVAALKGLMDPVDLTLVSEATKGLTIAQFIETFFPADEHVLLKHKINNLIIKSGVSNSLNIETTKFNKFMERASNSPGDALNEIGYQLRKLIINPLIAKAVDRGAIEVVNFRAEDILVNEAELEGRIKPMAKLIAIMTNNFAVANNRTTQSTFNVKLSEILDSAGVAREGPGKNISVELFAKEFAHYASNLFLDGDITFINHEKALEGTLALNQGLKPFAGKLGFTSKKVRLWTIPLGSIGDPNAEKEFIQAAAEEILISFFFERYGLRLPHKTINKLSNELAEAAIGIKHTPTATSKNPNAIFREIREHLSHMNNLALLPAIRTEAPIVEGRPADLLMSTGAPAASLAELIAQSVQKESSEVATNMIRQLGELDAQLAEAAFEVSDKDAGERLEAVINGFKGLRHILDDIKHIQSDKRAKINALLNANIDAMEDSVEAAKGASSEAVSALLKQSQQTIIIDDASIGLEHFTQIRGDADLIEKLLQNNGINLQFLTDSPDITPDAVIITNRPEGEEGLPEGVQLLRIEYTKGCALPIDKLILFAKAAIIYDSGDKTIEPILQALYKQIVGLNATLDTANIFSTIIKILPKVLAVDVSTYGEINRRRLMALIAA